MPIIRQSGGFFGNAGEGVAQTRSANAQARESALRVADLRRKEKFAELASVRQAQLDIENAERSDQRLVLEERRQRVNEAAFYSGASYVNARGAGRGPRMPISGAGVMSMFGRIEQRDPDRAAALLEDINGSLGGAFGPERPFTAESLDAMEESGVLASIYSRVTSEAHGLLNEETEQAATVNFGASVERVLNRHPEFEKAPGAEELVADFELALLDPKITPAKAAVEARKFEMNVERHVRLADTRRDFATRIDEALGAKNQGGGMYEEELDRVRELQIEMASSDTPEREFALAMSEIDPGYRAAREVFTREGEELGRGRAAVSQARAEQRAQRVAADEAAGVRPVDKNATMGTVTAETHPEVHEIISGGRKNLVSRTHNALRDRDGEPEINRRFLDDLEEAGINPRDGHRVKVFQEEWSEEYATATAFSFEYQRQLGQFGGNPDYEEVVFAAALEALNKRPGFGSFTAREAEKALQFAGINR